MSFAALLIHRVSISRQVAVMAMGEPTLDEYGQPITVPELVTGVPAAIQPKTVREVAAISQAGAEIGDYTIFLSPVHLSSAAAIVHDASDCPVEPDLGDVTYQITGIKPMMFGSYPHLEIDASLVQSGLSETAETGS